MPQVISQITMSAHQKKENINRLKKLSYDKVYRAYTLINQSIINRLVLFLYSIHVYQSVLI